MEQKKLKVINEVLTLANPEAEINSLANCFILKDGNRTATYQVLLTQPYFSGDGESIEAYYFSKYIAPVDFLVFAFEDKTKWMLPSELKEFLKDEENRASETYDSYYVGTDFKDYCGKTIGHQTLPEIFYHLDKEKYECRTF